jgi:hypothetical protein
MRAFQWVVILAVLGIVAVNGSSAHADEYSDAIEIFAKSATDKTFF